MTFEKVKCSKCKEIIIIYSNIYTKREIDNILCYKCYINSNKELREK